MKNKLVFRILGALASALIIASVFIPFISVTGYSQSLWETHNAVGTIYLPIMIIAFGVIGVLVFSTGFKIELAYASAGGLLFFLIMQTVPVIDQNLFNTLGVGYYCLAIGTFLIIIMAFICGLKVKHKVVVEKIEEEPKELSVINQIDKLYNDQSDNNLLNESNNLENIIQPLPISEVSQMPVENSVQTENNIQSPVEIQNSESVQNLNSVNEQTISSLDSAISEFEDVTSSFNVDNSIVEEKISMDTQNIEQPVMNFIEPQFTEPVIQNLQNNDRINPVISEFNMPIQNMVTEERNIVEPNIYDQSINPVVSEFSEPIMQNLQNSDRINPVISEFNNPMPTESASIFNNNFAEQYVNESMNEKLTNEVNTDEEIKTLDNVNKVDVMAEPTNNSSNLDIFG